MIVVPLAPQVASQVQENLRAVGNRQVVMSAPAPPTFEANTNDESTPRISPTIIPGLRQGRRMVALDVISRLQEEARRKGGDTKITPLDLKRLRNALRETESDAVPISGAITLSPAQ